MKEAAGHPIVRIKGSVKHLGTTIDLPQVSRETSSHENLKPGFGPRM